ncbi:MAG: ParA family protein [Deltaproteobacteria bacterium]|nr:MAG: ParA family protein [Deltaproteobacteria bacterium]TMQ23666.1 MAG: ParA family protein [Deltaproteobacteria bacterium]
MIPTIGFFNSKRGVGTTSLVYHLAWMYADQEYRVLAVDLDPQADLTAEMVDVERLEALWSSGGGDTIYGALRRAMEGGDQIASPHRESIAGNLELLAGDLSISDFEDELASQWSRCLDGNEHAFRAVTAFHRCIQEAAEAALADVILVDLGPNLGPINRAALLACHHIVVPVAPDLFALQGLRNLGPVVCRWHDEWQERVSRSHLAGISLIKDTMRLAGYVVLQGAVRLDHPMHSPEGWWRPTPAADAIGPRGDGPASSARTWISVIPDVYATATGLMNPAAEPSSDPHCLGLLKWYASLMPIAQEARKPVFHLRPADGALGAHAVAAREARKDYKDLADRIGAATWHPGKPSRAAQR